MTRADTDIIRAALLGRVEDLCELAFGERAKARGSDWRPKASGAISVVVRGPDRGLWCDHRDPDRGGNVFDLAALALCGLEKAGQDFRAVKAAAAGFCGFEAERIDPDPAVLAKLEADRQRIAREAAEAAEKDEARRRKILTGLQAKATPVEGTLAAAYLKGRGISRFPSCYAYAPPVPELKGSGMMRPELPALIVWGTDCAGNVTGGQRVLLSPEGRKADVPPGQGKPSFGSMSPVRLPAQREGGPLFIAEGPETAATIWEATGCEVWAMLSASNFATAPIPAGRRVTLCPDRDAKGSPAFRAFWKAAHELGRAGHDVWIAEAPEPEGGKGDFNDTAQRAGLDAVREALRAAWKLKPEPEGPDRGRAGRFTGTGAVPFTGSIPETSAPLPVRAARAKGGDDIKRALGAALEWDGEGEPPVSVIKMDPGGGKSTMMRQALKMLRAGAVQGDIRFHTPTTSLADEAAGHAASLGMESHVIRGRSPDNCARFEEVDRAAKAGLPITPNFCRSVDDRGEEHVCPHFDRCPYQNALRELGDGPALRFEAHAYLNLADPAKGRETGLRIIDETFWRGQARAATIPLDDLSHPRSIGVPKPKDRDARAAKVADLLQASDVLMAALRRGEPVAEALGAYTPEELRGFAEAETYGDARVQIFPDSAPDAVSKALNAAEAAGRSSGARARLWRILAEAREAGDTEIQRVLFVPGYTPKRDSEPRDVLRIFWRVEPPRDKPVIVLDADADPLIMEGDYPGASFHETRLLPNAYVIQITDRTFSQASLSRAGVREEWRKVLWRERQNDPGGGVLAIATRKVVRSFFEDAGHDFTDWRPEDVSAFMLKTPLHGVRWLWFGPASLGDNRWQDCTTAVVIGREEWPVSELENMARAVFGSGLSFIEPSETGETIMPLGTLPLVMADGSVLGVQARAHPDPRIRAIQLQARECATRQAIERLRLAVSPVRKRVVVGSAVPIPGLPVTEAVTWDDFIPTRAESALVESGGCLRLSAKGLSEDAPHTFPTQKAAEKHLEREGGAEGVFTPRAANISIITGAGGKSRVLVSFKHKGRAGRFPTKAVMLCEPHEAAALAAAKWGELSGFQILDVQRRELSEDEARRADEAEEREAIQAESAPRPVESPPAPVPWGASPHPEPERLDAYRKVKAETGAAFPETPPEREKTGAGTG